MDRVNISIVLLFIPIFLFSQKGDVCRLLNMVYKNEIQGKYQRLYIADSVYSSDIGSEKQFILNFQSSVPEKILRKVFLENKMPGGLYKISCFNDSLLGNKESLIKKIRKQNRYPDQEDSSYVKYVNKRQAEIVKISDSEERNKLMVELTNTEEFKKYTALMNFKTDRIIIFSKPILVKKFLFLMVETIKAHSDDNFGVIYVYEKDGNNWTLHEKKNFPL